MEHAHLPQSERSAAHLFVHAVMTEVSAVLHLWTNDKNRESAPPNN